MPELDLQEYEWNVEVRQLRIEDFDALLEMQARCFPGMLSWERDQIESQLAIFPEGQIVIEIDGKLAASSSSLMLQYESGIAWHDWKKIADGGFIRNHNKNGDTLYGIEIMVDAEYRGMNWPADFTTPASSFAASAISTASSSVVGSQATVNIRTICLPASTLSRLFKRHCMIRC